MAVWVGLSCFCGLTAIECRDSIIGLGIAYCCQLAANLSVFITSLVMITTLNEIQTVTDENKETLDQYSFSDCSDDYSVVDAGK